MTRTPSVSASLLLITFASLLILSCGSSNVSSSPPPKPGAPLFTSTAPLDAFEGQKYTYSVSATDPGGASITFALTKAPDGTTLSGNTVSWTPQWEQSRRSNAFEIIATNAQGVSARQNWSVSPAGTVYARLIDTYIHADGTQEQLPRDLSTWQPAIYFPSENMGGSPAILPVSVAGGIALYRNVPAGHFYIPTAYGRSLWTDKSDIDLGTILYGRLVDQDPPGATLTAVNGISSQSGWLDFYVFNIRAGGLLANWTTVTPLRDWTGSVPVSFDPTKGDSIYVLEHDDEGELADQTRLAGVAQLTSVPEGANHELEATLLPVPEDLSFRLYFGSSAWAAALNKVHTVSSSFRGFQGGAFAHPLPVKKYNYSDGQGLLTFDDLGVELGGSLPQTDLDFGWAYFGNPFPDSWQLEFSLLARTMGHYLHAGDDITLTGEIGFTSPTPPGQSDILVPLVRPVTNITVEGNNAMSAEFTISTNWPTINWTPPTGAPRIAGYVVTVCPLEQDGPYWSCTGGGDAIYTTETSVKLTGPIAWLGDGLNILSVRVITDPDADFATKPLFRRPTAWADAFTTLFYVMQ